MRRILKSQSGQLLLPMLALMVLFGVFLAGYVKWCRAIYWQMRMDLAAEAVALSAARAQAAMLNNIASLQTLENAPLQKGRVFGIDVGHMQLSAKNAFETANGALTAAITGFNGQIISVAQKVARENKAEAAFPYPVPGPHLEPRRVWVAYFHGPKPSGMRRYDKAYFVRQWGEGQTKPQPDHIVTWAVRGHGTVGTATARVWLDVGPDAFINNGGFPGKDQAWWRDLGIQCFHPHFNARLAPTPIPAAQALKRLLGG